MWPPLSDAPATLVRELNADLTVEDGGETIALDEFLARLDKKALPGLRIEDMATAQAFAQYVEENGVVDVNVPLLRRRGPEDRLRRGPRHPGDAGLQRGDA